MNGKMVIKLTLNEATDPDLYAHLAKFDNVRLRAGALKAAAGAAVRGDHSYRGLRPIGPVLSMPSVDPGLRRQSEAGGVAEIHGTLPESVPTAPAIAPVRDAELSHELSSPSRTPASCRQWETDLIGEQFADF